MKVQKWLCLKFKLAPVALTFSRGLKVIQYARRIFIALSTGKQWKHSSRVRRCRNRSYPCHFLYARKKIEEDECYSRSSLQRRPITSLIFLACSLLLSTESKRVSTSTKIIKNTTPFHGAQKLSHLSLLVGKNGNSFGQRISSWEA